MSHENTNDIHHADDQKPTVPFRSSLIFVLFIIALFVAAVNFVNVMGHDTDGGHGAGHGTEAAHHDAATTGHDDHGTTDAAAHDDADHGAEHHDAAGDEHAH